MKIYKFENNKKVKWHILTDSYNPNHNVNCSICGKWHILTDSYNPNHNVNYSICGKGYFKWRTIVRDVKNPLRIKGMCKNCLKIIKKQDMDEANQMDKYDWIISFECGYTPFEAIYKEKW